MDETRRRSFRIWWAGLFLCLALVVAFAVAGPPLGRFGIWLVGFALLNIALAGHSIYARSRRP